MIKVVVLSVVLVVSLSMVLVSISYFGGRIVQRFLVLLAVLMLGYLGLSVLEVLPHPSFLDPYIDGLIGRIKTIWLLGLGISVIGLLGWILCFNRELSWNGLMLDFASKIIP